MGETKSKTSAGDHNEQRYKYQRHQQILIEALSRAAHVAGNKSFDHNICTENHPGGSSLRTKLEKRWSNLVLATASSTSGTEISDLEGISENANNDDHLPTSSSWFQNIYDRHTEPERHYHTVVHLWEMFELLDIAIVKLKAPKWYVPMAWSIFFHDSIYDPKSNRNEKDSAELFRGFVNARMATAMDKITFDTAVTMILATEKHKVILPNTGSGTASIEDEQEEITMQEYFLDIDMAVLGKHRDAYFEYAALIRREYEFVTHDVYCSKRAEILETFLIGTSNSAHNDSDSNHTSTKKWIYLTESFRGAFEDAAKENLRDEIELLRNNNIPG